MHLHSYSIAKIGKEKNGDHMHLEQLSEERLLVAMVADGVSQQPTDWLASEMACQKFMEAFSNSKQLDLAKRIETSVAFANKSIMATATKMASTLSVCVLEMDNSTIHWSSIGDSRIYKLGPGTLVCLTEDDAELQSRLISSQHRTFRENRSVLSQVMGQDEIKIEVMSDSLKGETLILATDGFYNARKASFEKRMLNFQQQADFDTAFDEMVEQFAMLRGDDLTVIAIR